MTGQSAKDLYPLEIEQSNGLRPLTLMLEAANNFSQIMSMKMLGQADYSPRFVLGIL